MVNFTGSVIGGILTSPGSRSAEHWSTTWGTTGEALTVGLAAVAALVSARMAMSGSRAARGPGLLLALGIALHACGTATFAWVEGSTHHGFPSASELLWLGFYACALTSLGLQATRALAPVPPGFWLDAAIVGVICVALGAELLSGSGLAGDAIGLEMDPHVMYPLLDAGWLGCSVALASATGLWRLRTSLLAPAGVVVLLVADVLILQRVIGGAASQAWLFHAVAAAGLLLVASGRGAPAGIGARPRSARSRAVLPAIGGLVLLGLIGGDQATDGELWPPAVLAVSLAVVLSTARLVVTLRDNTRLLSERRQAVERAQRSEDRYRRILETTGEGVWLANEENCITFVNPRLAEMLGSTQEKLVGRSMLELIPRGREAEARGRVVALGSGALRNREGPLKRIGGGEIWALISSSPLIDADGTFDGSVGMVTDITDRRNAEQEIRFQAGLLDHVNAALLATDTKGVITYWSRGAQDLFHLAAGEAIGQLSHGLLAPEVAVETFESVAEEVAQRGGAQHELELTRGDGKRVTTDARIAPIHDEHRHLLGYVAVVLDVSERKRADRDEAAQHAVTRVIAAARTVAEAQPRLLEALADASGCDASTLWLADGPDFHCAAHWQRPDPRSNGLRGATEAARLTGSADLPTQLKAGLPVQLAGLRALGSTREAAAAGEGFVRVIAIPITSGDDSLGFVELLSRRAEPIDESLLRTLGALGGQVGQFVLRRKAEESLRITAERLQAILDNTSALIYAKDRDFRYLLVNRELARRFGRPAADLVGTRDDDLLPPETVERLREGDRLVLDEGRVLQTEECIPVGDEERTLLTVRFPLRDTSGRAYAVCGIATDVTEAKQGEEALRRSQARLNEAQRVTQVGSWEWDVETGETTWSDELFRICGQRADSFVPSYEAWVGLSHPDDAERVRRAVENTVATGHPFRYVSRIVQPDGAVRVMESRGEADFNAEGRVIGLHGTSQDITTRHATEEALARSRRSLIEAQEMARVGSWECDLRTGEASWSDEACRIFGLPVGSAPALEEVVNVVHPDDRELFHDVQNGARHVPSMRSAEHRIVRPDGEIRWLATRLRLERAADGTALRLRGVAQDVTERRVAEQQLRESEERYRRIVETAQEGVWIIDADARTTFVNARMAEMLGTSTDDMLSRTVFDFHPPEMRERIESLLALRRAGVVGSDAARLVRPDGDELPVHMSTTPLVDGNGRYLGALAMVADMTARVEAEQQNERLQAQLHQSQKLDSLGQLAGGVAHDFNNLLAVILNYAEFAEEDAGVPERLGEDIASIREAAERAAELTRQLLLFARQETVAPELVDLNQVVAQVERLLLRTLGEHIDVSTRLSPDVPLVHADPGRIEQVLANLALNARDAITGTGSIVIETGDELVTESRFRGRSVVPGRFSRITVRDTGRGMAPEVVGRAFDPFYTTKPRGSGTGLGLATAYGIVTAAGGTIELSSEEGVGTAVDVYLPAAEEESPQHTPHEEPPVIPGKGELVLVVEDEDHVREVTCRTLRRNGYRVLAAGTAEAAKALWDEHRESVELVLTDVVMPGGAGTVLVDELRACRSDLRCIFMSGYTDDVLLRHGARDGDVTLLEKPFHRATLLRAVSDALRGEDGRSMSSPRAQPEQRDSRQPVAGGACD